MGVQPGSVCLTLAQCACPRVQSTGGLSWPREQEPEWIDLLDSCVILLTTGKTFNARDY